MSRRSNPRGEMPFLDHLEELRWVVLWSLLAIMVGMGIGFAVVYLFDVLELLIAPVREVANDPDLMLQYLSPADPFFVTLKLALYLGLVLASPIVVSQVWRFLSPALETRERRAIVPALYFTVLLFLAGMSLAYFVALPVTLEFFNSFQEGSLTADLEINRTLGFIVKILIAFGVVFELPIVVLVLSMIGIVTPQWLRAKRRHAIVAIAAGASVITPGDVISLTILMMVPLVLLYEVGIWLSVLVYRRKKQAAEELDADLDPPPDSVAAG
ncbi:MAG: twin-arginine translocase subunit TatC [Gemmatimonadetes bacterium]|nr:twin-arginine translocase subunit TatC [Gemmatimonadota bacterium]